MAHRDSGWLAYALALGICACLLSLPANADDIAAQQGQSAQANSLAMRGCGSLRNAYGPYDYRDPAARGEPLRKVERYHFSQKIENLQVDRALGSIHVMANLNYVLRAFPNHYRALNSVMKWELRGGKITKEDFSTADCYFRRAEAFAPDDSVVRMLYGNYLAGKGELAQSIKKYEESLELSPDAAETHYNIGLAYVKLGDLPRARKHADIAYQAGYPLQGLKKQLRDSERAP